jgi:hypothetical protein
MADATTPCISRHAAADNPELPPALIVGILEAQAELEAGLAEPYSWGPLPPEPGEEG